MSSYLHSGDLGDAIYALPSVAALGGGTIYFGSKPWTRTRWEDGTLVSQLRTLFETQDYVEGIDIWNGQRVDIDFSTFRHGGYKLGDTIIERQRRWVGANLREEKNGGWMKVEGKRISPIIINRASRWLGFHFPWDELVGELGKDMVFIGLGREHRDFEKLYGKVAYYDCQNLFEAGQVIAGADLFIGNQSAPLAIANGLGKPVVVEVCPYAPDCFLKRPNASYSVNGELDFRYAGERFVRDGFKGAFKTIVADREFSDNDEVMLKVTARAAHAQDGTFMRYEEVEVYG